MPAWSPDGSRIAYYHSPGVVDSSYAEGLYMLDLATGTRSLIVEGPAFNPDWSSDGEWLAFNSGDVLKIRPNGEDLQQVTEVGSAFFQRGALVETVLPLIQIIMMKMVLK